VKPHAFATFAWLVWTTLLLHMAQEVAPRQPAWTRTFASPGWNSWRPPVTAALSPNARCAAIAHSGLVTVFDIDGAERWSWNYAEVSRYISPTTLALAPSCDAVAVVGDAGYKFTWLVRRHGGARPLHTTSTPLSAAFDSESKHLAVGTGGNTVQLHALDGRSIWKSVLSGGCCIVSNISFSADDRFILLRDGGPGLLTRDGDLTWSAFGQHMSASTDLQTFVTWAVPPHGPGPGHVGVLDHAGSSLWSAIMPTSDAGAAVSASGDRIAVWVGESSPTLDIRDRFGAVITSLPVASGQPLAFSPDADRLLLRTRSGLDEVDMSGETTWRFAANPDEFSEAIREVIVASDYSGVLVLQGHPNVTVRWYRLATGG
jgi:hypothetical protein